jgi:fructosamine-3-kinase
MTTALQTDVIATNRYGLTFVENKFTQTYASGRRWNSYYKHACTRCGWSFAGGRWRGHRMADCDAVIAQVERGELTDPKPRNLGK